MVRSVETIESIYTEPYKWYNNRLLIGKSFVSSVREKERNIYANRCNPQFTIRGGGGTGIYGSIVSGMTGDHTILISKSILDLFTAAIFGCTLGAVVSLVAIPQCIIFLLLFYAATAIYPLTNEAMIADFKACGGFVLQATGFRMIRVKMFPIADMIPAMILVMPISALWANYIMPLVS